MISFPFRSRFFSFFFGWVDPIVRDVFLWTRRIDGVATFVGIGPQEKGWIWTWTVEERRALHGPLEAGEGKDLGSKPLSLGDWLDTNPHEAR